MNRIYAHYMIVNLCVKKFFNLSVRWNEFPTRTLKIQFRIMCVISNIRRSMLWRYKGPISKKRKKAKVYWPYVFENKPQLIFFFLTFSGAYFRKMNLKIALKAKVICKNNWKRLYLSSLHYFSSLPTKFLHFCVN